MYNRTVMQTLGDFVDKCNFSGMTGNMTIILGSGDFNRAQILFVGDLSANVGMDRISIACGNYATVVILRDGTQIDFSLPALEPEQVTPVVQKRCWGCYAGTCRKKHTGPETGWT